MGSEKSSTTEPVKKRLNLARDYFSYIKIILVLALVIGIIYGVFFFMKKTLKIKDDTAEGGTVITSQTIGPGKTLQVVSIGGKYLILGITNDNINLLSEINDPREIERLEIIVNNRKTEEGNTFFDSVSDFFKHSLKIKPKKEGFDYETDSVEFLKKQKERIDKLKE